MNERTKAVFLSYASQDADPARRICDALRAAGVEVWFDQSELRGGDSWDAKIRKQIKECALFVPVISANTQARREGYFRREWKLAVERTHDMDEALPFLVPVVIDGTTDAGAFVPEKFRDVQWTRLRRAYGGQARLRQTEGGQARLGSIEDGAQGGQGWGESTAEALDDARVGAFAARVKTLLDGPPDGPLVAGLSAPPRAAALRPRRRFRVRPALGVATAFALVALSFAVWRVSGFKLNAAATTPAGELIARAWEQLNDPALSRSQLDVADELCRRATALDPDNADAWAAWSQVDTWYVYHHFDDTPARREQARAKAARALQIAPTAFEPRLAQVGYFVRAAGPMAPERVAEVEQSLRALQTQRPEEPRVLFALAILLEHGGRYDEAAAVFERLERNPAFAATALNELAWMYCLAEPSQFARAMDACDRSIALQPFWANLALKAMLATVWLGDLDAATAALNRVPMAQLADGFLPAIAFQVQWNRRDPAGMLRALATHPGEWMNSNYFTGPVAYLAGVAHNMAGDHDAAVTQWHEALKQIDDHLVAEPDGFALHRINADTLARLGEKQAAGKEFELAQQLATTPHMRRIIDYDRAVLFDDADSAFAQLERGVASGSRGYTAATLRLLPDLDRLRGDPRFAALLRRAEADPRLSPTAKPAGTNPTAADSTSAVTDKSVAVLAFDNLSDDEANEYFSDGISEELISALGRVPGLTVKGSTSAFYFKHKENQFSSAEIARQLGVTYLVRGSVRKAGDQVRITAQLTRAATDEVVWSLEPATREVKDVFSVQEEVARLIAQKLELKLGGSAAKPTTVNPQAYELYLQARQAWNLRNEDGYDRAEKLLAQSIALAPDFAPAHAAMVDVWSCRGQDDRSISHLGDRESPAVMRIVAKGRQAIALDPGSAEAHASLGGLWWTVWRFAQAERELREAIRLNPNYASAHQWLGRTLMTEGRLDDALVELKQAAELDPLSPRILDNYSLALLNAQRPAGALDLVERALRLQPNAEQALVMKAMALAQLGESDAAAGAARSLSSDYALQAEVAFVTAGKLDAAAALLASIPQNDLEARIAALIGLARTDEALATLKPELLISGTADLLLFNPVFDPLRSDPRFREVLKTVGLAEANDRAQAWRAAHPPHPGGQATEDGGRKK